MTKTSDTTTRAPIERIERAFVRVMQRRDRSRRWHTLCGEGRALRGARDDVEAIANCGELGLGTSETPGR